MRPADPHGIANPGSDRGAANIWNRGSTAGLKIVMGSIIGAAAALYGAVRLPSMIVRATPTIRPRVLYRFMAQPLSAGLAIGAGNAAVPLGIQSSPTHDNRTYTTHTTTHTLHPHHPAPSRLRNEPSLLPPRSQLTCPRRLDLHGRVCCDDPQSLQLAARL
jgi:hypothetical protein